MGVREIVVRPVGVVRNQQKEIGPGSDSSGVTSRIEIDPALDGILDGIEGFSHLLVLWWPHQKSPGREMPIRVHPMGRQDLPERGVFATRSPLRPNCILATVVKLVAHRGHLLEVTGLDAIDGSPVLDIKPLTPRDCPDEELKVPEWLEAGSREGTQ